MSDALLKRLQKLAGAGALVSKERFETGNAAHVDRAAAALLERFYRENDAAAFELLVEISQPLLGEAARQITRDIGLAIAPGELVAEYFSKIFVDLRPPANRIEGLVAAATASMKEEATRRVRTLARRIRPIEEEAGANAPANDLTADQRLAGRFAALVSMCFHGLDETDRRLLLALEIDRLSYAEIGERFGIYQDEVPDRVVRARGRLAARIAAVFSALAPKDEGGR